MLQSPAQAERKSRQRCILTLVMGAILSIASSPTAAQTSKSNQAATCNGHAEKSSQSELFLQARLDPLLFFPGNYFVIATAVQDFTGRLACADPRPAFYNCGHTRNSVWGCKPDCLVEPDGWQYVLQADGKTYSVAGDPDRIRPFLADRVIVTGELKGDRIKLFSISKAPRNTTGKGLTSESGPR